MTDLDTTWVDALLSDTRAVVTDLLREPLIADDTLRAEVRAYKSAIEAAPAADHELGLALVEGACKLLDAVTNPRAHRLVQVAVRYFVMDDDGDDDLASAFGFDDDVEVFNAVARVLERHDLLIDLD